MLSIASILTTPICWASSMALRLISPMNQLGEYDFCTTTVKECALRVIYALSLLPLFIVGFVLLMPSIVVRRIAIIIQKNGFSYASGNAKEKLFTGTVAAFSWNICGMPAGLSRPFGGMVEWSKRIDKITDKILTSRADIVCLQEVLDTSLCEQLKKRLLRKYKHIYYHIGCSSYRLGSGIFIASKFRIENFTYTPFKTLGKKFRMHHKGFVSGTFQSAENTLQFIATHTCAGPPQVSANVRNRQIRQMLEFSKNKSTIYIGDFNIDRFSDEWKNSPLSDLKGDHTFQDFTATDKYKYEMFDNNPSKSPQVQIDHMLTNHEANISTELMADIGKLSDHRALVFRYMPI